MPDVIPSLLELKRAGFAFVIVTNQDGAGTGAFPRDSFDRAQRFLSDLFHSQGIDFEAVFVCPHLLHEGCGCRKPGLGLVQEWLNANPLDRKRSFVIGDRDSDLEFARNLGIEGLRIRLDGDAAHSWPGITRHILGLGRRGQVHRKTKETDVLVEVDLSREGPSRVVTGLGFFDHMLEQIAKHGGFALNLACQGDLHIDEHHTIEDCAIALGSGVARGVG